MAPLIAAEEQRKHETLIGSRGTGAEAAEMFSADIAGDLATIQRMQNKDSSLVRCMYAYRTPLYFAVRENQIPVTAFLLEHGADPTKGSIHDSLLDIARDRGYAQMQKLLQDTFGISPQ